MLTAPWGPVHIELTGENAKRKVDAGDIPAATAIHAEPVAKGDAIAALRDARKPVLLVGLEARAQGAAQAITAAVNLGVADVLADGPLRLEDLASHVDADPDALRRLLRALIGRGVFRQRRDGRYEIGPLAAI